MSYVHFEPEPGAQDAMPQIKVPRGPLLGALAVVLVAASAAVAGRLFDLGATREGAPAAGRSAAVPVAQRALRFADAPGGELVVHDAASGALVARLAPGGDGFLRGTLRAVARQRARAGRGAESPFLLTRWSDGRLTLDDSVAGTHVAVTSFGRTQVASVGRLLDPPAAAR